MLQSRCRLLRQLGGAIRDPSLPDLPQHKEQNFHDLGRPSLVQRCKCIRTVVKQMVQRLQSLIVPSHPPEVIFHHLHELQVFVHQILGEEADLAKPSLEAIRVTTFMLKEVTLLVMPKLADPVALLEVLPVCMEIFGKPSNFSGLGSCSNRLCPSSYPCTYPKKIIPTEKSNQERKQIN